MFKPSNTCQFEIALTVCSQEPVYNCFCPESGLQCLPLTNTRGFHLIEALDQGFSNCKEEKN